MKKRLNLIVMFSALLCMAGATQVFAGPPHKHDGGRKHEMAERSPTAVPNGFDAAQVRDSIVTAIETRNGWSVAGEKPNRILARLHVRSHTAMIVLSYSSKDISVEYHSSENLRYQEARGKIYIHDAYDRWVDNLLATVLRQFKSEAAIKTSPDAVGDW